MRAFPLCGSYAEYKAPTVGKVGGIQIRESVNDNPLGPAPMELDLPDNRSPSSRYLGNPHPPRYPHHIARFLKPTEEAIPESNECNSGAILLMVLMQMGAIRRKSVVRQDHRSRRHPLRCLLAIEGGRKNHMRSIQGSLISRQTHHLRHQSILEIPTKTRIPHTKMRKKIRDFLIDQLEAGQKEKVLLRNKKAGAIQEDR